ncbi:MAG: DUF3179 domain-containing protein [Merismopedia sp. SIO2A8]|nr:DUF3179 domain-containing protein [Merismopedia sp. SIO2A8]
MKRFSISLLSVTSAAVLLLSVAVVRAGGWDDFKLRYYGLTQIFHDQDQELDDLRKQEISLTDNSRIELAQLLNGGPPKDGIPSIDAPEFDTVANTPFQPTDIVIGVEINGEAKAYPFNIMNWHEIVNDTVGGVNVTVSYCPLCDTIVTFKRGDSTFGVSGKLYQSCLIMYDRADDTLYAQPWAMGVVGPKVNRALDRIPAVKTTLGEWLAKYPDSKILSTRTGYNRDYQGYPYGSYYTNEQIIFPVRNQDERSLHPKAIVSYIWEGNMETPHNEFSGISHQFVHDDIRELGRQEVVLGNSSQEGLHQRTVQAYWDENLSTVIVKDMDGTVIPSTTAFAFVYPAFF